MLSSFNESLTKATAKASETAASAKASATAAATSAKASATAAASTAASAASAAASSATESAKQARASYVASSNKESATMTTTLHIRRGCVKCGCGKVQIDLVVPPTSYNEIDNPSFLCHCGDCVGVPTALNEMAQKKVEDGEQTGNLSIDVVDRSCNAVHELFFYNADVKVVSGKELIGFHKLTPNSKTIRFYCTACLTPLGFRRTTSTTIYGKLIIQPMPSDADSDTTKTMMVGDVFPSPTHAFFRSRAPADSGPVPDGVIVRSLNNAPMAIMKILRWDALGKRLHKLSDKAGVELPTEQKDVLIGWESIRPSTESSTDEAVTFAATEEKTEEEKNDTSSTAAAAGSTEEEGGGEATKKVDDDGEKDGDDDDL